MNSRISGAIPVCLLLFVPDAAAQDAVDLAARLIGRPYVWGAEGPREFDCSGLTQYVYERVGVDLPRQAIQQSKAGDAAGRRLQRGDLLFFSTDTRRGLVTHVGLYEGNGVMAVGHRSAERFANAFCNTRNTASGTNSRGGTGGGSLTCASSSSAVVVALNGGSSRNSS